ncbi:hypothetical protein OB13_15505, partial [Pontibacter sp. HJ8]
GPAGQAKLCNNVRLLYLSTLLASYKLVSWATTSYRCAQSCGYMDLMKQTMQESESRKLASAGDCYFIYLYLLHDPDRSRPVPTKYAYS